MLSIFLICLGLVADDGAQPPAKAPADRAAYEAARRAAGQDAAANVRLALWCERHGMTAERMKHLAAAVLHDPSNGLARGLLGLVAYDGKWEPPDEVSRKAQDDPKRQALMEEYLRRRAKAPDKADDQAKLAAWCDQNGLKNQAVAHYHAVLRLDPRREVAWKHLGFKKAGGHWVKPEWQAAAKQEADEQGRANKHWKPLLEQWRVGLSSRARARKASAEAGLAGVTDPRAVPMVWAVFVQRGAEGQKTAVRVLGQIDSPGSSRALALLALSSKSAEARGEATQILRQRDPRDFAPLLIGLIRDPIKYEVKQVAGPGKPGELVIKDGTTNRKRLYSPPPAPQFAMGPTDYVSLDASGLPVINRFLGQYSVVESLGGMYTPQQARAMLGLNGPSPAYLAGMLQKAGLSSAASQKLGATLSANSAVSVVSSPVAGQVDMARFLMNQTLQVPIGEMMLEAQMAAQAAEAQLAGDVRAIAAYNGAIRGANQRAREVLSGAVGADLGDDQAAWSKWLVDLFGYAFHAQQSSSEETTVVEQVPPSYVPQTTPIVTQSFTGSVALWHSCFAAGTLVRTLDGLRPIESLRAGDLVLTQDAKSGELKYQAIVTVYHNPPNSTYRVALDGGDPIVATGIHRLWKAGKGWVMTRELKPGDRLRTLGGLATVVSVEADRTQLVYNLQVADGESYFVGKSGVLAHDNSTINPVPEPFDAVGPLLSTTPAEKPKSMLGR